MRLFLIFGAGTLYKSDFNLYLKKCSLCFKMCVCMSLSRSLYVCVCLCFCVRWYMCLCITFFSDNNNYGFLHDCGFFVVMN